MFRRVLEQIKFHEGVTISLDDADILVFVGPNGSGKSQALRDIVAAMGGVTGKVVCAVTLANLPWEDVEEMLRRRFRVKGSASDRFGEILLPALDYHTISALSKIAGHKYGSFDSEQMGELKKMWAAKRGHSLPIYLMSWLRAEDRLSAASAVENINYHLEDPTSPMHEVFRYREIENVISAQALQAFGERVAIDRSNPKNVQFITGEHARSLSIDETKDCIPLENQGDGLRSFVGTLLYAYALPRAATLLDEPEAFLHPPQAYRLGRFIGLKAVEKTQLFISTHSSSLLQGLLDSGARVHVVRLQRNLRNETTVNYLSPDEINRLWADSLLRTSNAFDALFHDAAVLCEADADARFYSLVAERVSEGREDAPSIHFIPTFGKDRLYGIANALSSLGVPTVLVADIDIISSGAILRRSLEALGASAKTLDNVESLRTRIDKAVRQTEQKPTVSDVLAVLAQFNETAYVPRSLQDTVRRTMEGKGGWKNAKHSGKAGLPSGDAQNDFDALYCECRNHGLFIVPEGELEGFNRSLGNHGPKWLAKVVVGEIASSPAYSSARTFVSEVLDWVASQTKVTNSTTPEDETGEPSGVRNSESGHEALENESSAQNSAKKRGFFSRALGWLR